MHKKRLARASIQRCPDPLLDLREPLCSREGQGRNGSRQARDKRGRGGIIPQPPISGSVTECHRCFCYCKRRNIVALIRKCGMLVHLDTILVKF